MILEDRAADAELMIHELRRAGFDPDWQRVETEPDYLAALETNLDLILIDWSLPQFSGLHALQLMNERGLDIPFIIVSGSIGEDAAIEAIRHGAADYLLKDRLARLGNAVQHALENKRLQIEHKRAEEQLRYQAVILANVNDAIVASDSQYLLTAWNKAAEALYGWKAEEVLGRSGLEITCTELPEAEAGVMRRMLAEIGHWRGEATQVRRNGIRFPVEVSSIVLRDGNGQVNGYVSVNRDITERKQAEAAMVQEKRLLRTVIDNLPDGIYVKDLQGRKILTNRADLENIGLPESEVLGKTDDEVYPPEVAAHFEADDQSVMQNGQPVLNREEQLANRQGKKAWLLTSKLPFKDVTDQVVGLVGISRDITERKVSDQQIEFQVNLLNSVGQAVIATDLEGRVIYCNRFAEILYGWPAHEMLGRNTIEFIKEESRGQALEIMDRLGKGLSWSGELLVRHRDGRNFPAIVTDTPLVDYQGEIVGIIGISMDITERKQAEETLRMRLAELEALYSVSTIQQTQTINELLPILLDKVLITLETDAGAIWFLNKDSQELERVVARGWLQQLDETPQKPNQGIVGTVFASRQTHFSADFSRDPLAQVTTSFKIPDGWGGVCIPVFNAGNIVAVLFVSVPLPRQVSVEQVRLVESMTEVAGYTIQRIILLKEAQDQAAQLGLLYDAGLALNSVLEPDEQLKFLFKIAMNTLNADQAAFFRYNLVQDELMFEMGLGFDTKSLAALKNLRFYVKDEEQPVGWVSRNSLPLNLTEHSSLSLGPKIDSRILSELYVPVKHDQTLIGVLCVFSSRGRAFSRQAERLLLLFANQAAVAFQNAHLITETRRHLEYLNTLHLIDIAIAGSFNLPKILAVILEQVTTQLGVDAACLLLFNPRQQTLVYAAGRGFRSRALEHTVMKPGQGFAGKAFLERRIIHIPDLHIRKTGFLRSPNFSAEEFIAYYAIPLLAKDKALGVLEIFHRSPLNPAQEWLDFLETLAGQAAIAINNTQLFDQLQSANQDLTLAYDETIEGWSKALDLRDKETEGHTLRVTEITLVLAQEMGINQEELAHVRRGCLLHDIGKLGVPDYILLKPGPLTEDEWKIMRKHPVYAYEMVVPIEYLKPAIDIPYCHHEKWDGSGYPRGLKGKEIPLTARIFAIVDVWDALTSDRPYRPAWPKEKALTYILEQSGQQFDPLIVEKFMGLIGNI